MDNSIFSVMKWRKARKNMRKLGRTVSWHRYQPNTPVMVEFRDDSDIIISELTDEKFRELKQVKPGMDFFIKREK